MQQAMRGQGSGAGPQPGLFGLAQQQQQQQQQGGTAAVGSQPSGTSDTQAGQNPLAGLESLMGGGTGADGQNPFAGLFGAGSPFGAGAGAGAGGFGAGAGAGGFNPPAPQPSDTRSPEERFEVR